MYKKKDFVVVTFVMFAELKVVVWLSRQRVNAGSIMCIVTVFDKLKSGECCFIKKSCMMQHFPTVARARSSRTQRVSKIST